MIAIWRREQWGEFQKVKQKESSLGADEIQFECETLECAVIFFFFFLNASYDASHYNKNLDKVPSSKVSTVKVGLLMQESITSCKLWIVQPKHFRRFVEFSATSNTNNNTMRRCRVSPMTQHTAKKCNVPLHIQCCHNSSVCFVAVHFFAKKGTAHTEDGTVNSIRGRYFRSSTGTKKSARYPLVQIILLFRAMMFLW